MKRKRWDQIERRRPLIELNLVARTRPRAADASQGCAALLGRVLIVVLLFVLVARGLT